ncbi:MAG: serine carboxypeptidase [Anaerolineae bacterium]|nr:serine carboxypeptidase [Anaerolineae bacterium]
MNKIVVLHFRPTERRTEAIRLLDNTISVEHIGCDKDLAVMSAHISDFDGKVDAIALEGVAKTLRIGSDRVTHVEGAKLFAIAQETPVVDGSGVRAAMERWALRLADDNQPGIWSRKQILLVPSLNHSGLTKAFRQYTEEVHAADARIYDPNAPILFSLKRMADQSFRLIFPAAGTAGVKRDEEMFKSADIIAGDMGAIRRYSPASLKSKTIVTEYATDEDVADLQSRNASVLVTTMPSLTDNDLAEHGAAVFEAALVSIREDQSAPLSEDTYLNLMADLNWSPGMRFLSDDAGINRFAFVIHPLSIKFIHNSPRFAFTKYLPDAVVERAASRIRPFYISKITGIESPATGQKIEGYLYGLGGTPKELMRLEPGLIYRQLIYCARMAERRGARLMGLGAFTSVVGDAGITVAQKSDIAITSGNSLTVAATLETAKQALVQMGHRLEDSRQGNVMVIGATGSIGSVCSRLLAQAIPNITLVAPRPEKLIALKRTIEEETPDAHVTISTSADYHVADADLIVTTTTALNQRIIDVSKCKPGAVVCDIARPPDITAEEAALRPDMLIIESGEILLPGNPDYGYDIGLPPGVAYACLAETALLAMEGLFEDYTLGREIEIDRVKEIYRLYKKHGLELSGIRSHGHFLTDEDLAEKRALADALRADPEKFAQVQTEAAAGLKRLDAEAGYEISDDKDDKSKLVVAGAAAGAAAAAVSAGLVFLRKRGH